MPASHAIILFEKAISLSTALILPAVHTGFQGSVGKFLSARSFPWHSSPPKEFQEALELEFKILVPSQWGQGISQGNGLEGDPFAAFKNREIKLL